MTGKQQDKKLIQELQAQIRALHETIEKISIDPSYGILTRQALELDLISRKGEVKFVAFLDVDYLHAFNEKYGHEEANNRIRRALHLRSTDLVLSGKWYSGDEIAVLLRGDPAAFCDRLQKAFNDEGMSITISWVPFSGKLDRDVEKAKKEVFSQKAKRGIQR